MSKMPEVRRMMGMDLPADWLCNAPVKHDPTSELCCCVGCIQNRQPHLITGDPQQTNRGNESWNQDNLRKAGYVGIYDPSLHVPDVVPEQSEENNKEEVGGKNGGS